MSKTFDELYTVMKINGGCISITEWGSDHYLYYSPYRDRIMEQNGGEEKEWRDEKGLSEMAVWIMR